MDATQQLVAVVVGCLTVVGLMAGWWYKFGRPMAATAEAILGRAEVTDRSGAVVQEAQPGMPAQVAELAKTVRVLVEMNRTVDGVVADVAVLRSDVASVSDRVTVLEHGAVERVASKVESAQAFKAIEAVALQQPDD